MRAVLFTVRVLYTTQYTPRDSVLIVVVALDILLYSHRMNAGYNTL